MVQPESKHLSVEEDRRLVGFYATINGLLEQVSHDFRTPLTVIKEFATLMHEGLVGTTSPRQREYLGVINDRADDLTLIVDNVLDAARSSAGVLRAWRRATDAGGVVLGLQAPLARKAAIKGVRLEVAVEPGLRPVYADGEQLARILTNVVAGVLKNFEGPEAVRLWASSDGEPGCVGLGVTVEGGQIGRKQLEAIDAALDQTRACDVGRARGTAWRLAMARRLADLHFGRIGFRHARGGRTTFRLSLPVDEPRCVLDAYVRHVGSRGGEIPAAQLVVASIGPGVESSVAGVVDEFLQSSVGAEDLVVHAEKHGWLLVVLGSEEVAASVLGQIDGGWSEMLRGSRGGLLPRLECVELGRWSLPDGASELVERFEADAATRSEASEGQVVVAVGGQEGVLAGSVE